MKKLILLLILTLISATIYSQGMGKNSINKTELIDLIEQAKKENKVSQDAIIVLDESTVIDLEDIEDDQEFFAFVRIINKGNKEMNEVYGENAENGIFMIQTYEEISYVDPTFKGNGVSYHKAGVVFFLDGKEIAEEELKNINVDSIDKVEVIKNKDLIAEITDKECDGIVKIMLKKKE